VKNEEVLLRVKEERSVIHAIKHRKANWIGHISRRNCLLKHVIEGEIEGTGSRKQLLDDLKDTRRYWNLKVAALDGVVWRTCFGRCYGPVARPQR
jgi:hypothetical protein